ncbi:MAG: hypothetical protein IJE55_06370 [Clostridia bacterium]|nr:hypothetical protein [Clostridia bacterium]
MPARNRKDMPMKSKRGKIIFTGVIILVLVIAAVIYKQPVEIEDMHKDWDFDECTSIDFYAKYGADGKYHNSGDFSISGFTFEKGDSGFEDIIYLFESKKVVRSFKRTKNVNIYYGQTGIDWGIAFNAKGERLELTDYEGEQVTVNGYRISIDKNDPWLKEVFDIAVKYAQADEQKPAV